MGQTAAGMEADQAQELLQAALLLASSFLNCKLVLSHPPPLSLLKGVIS